MREVVSHLFDADIASRLCRPTHSYWVYDAPKRPRPGQIVTTGDVFFVLEVERDVTYDGWWLHLLWRVGSCWIWVSDDDVGGLEVIA